MNLIPAHTETASASWKPERQPVSNLEKSRATSLMRPPSLAATHPYKYIGGDPAALSQGHIAQQNKMPSWRDPKIGWTPLTPESLPDDGGSSSPEPTKTFTTLMGPPPVPRRHKPSTNDFQRTRCSSTIETRKTSAKPQCYSKDCCAPHTRLYDPMMQHSTVPTLWRNDANVDQRDTDLANGSVTSPLAMIGLPLGGMIEMANYYPPDDGHRWSREKI